MHRVIDDNGRMPSLPTLAAFVLVVAAFAAVPGPSNLFVMAQGVRFGVRAGVVTAIGCALGAGVYVAATAAGLAALLASSTAALALLHYVGGVYLIVLGVRGWRIEATDPVVGPSPAPSAARVSAGSHLRRGVLVEISNPKVAVFFVAFLPQFVAEGGTSQAAQLAVLGLVFCLVGLVSDLLYGLGSGLVSARLRRAPSWWRATIRGSSAIYVGLGAWSIWSGARSETR